VTDPTEIRRLLCDTAAGYLRNPLRANGITCAICTTPVDGHRLCWPCAQTDNLPGTADLVVPLSYAIGGTQSGMLLRHYKDDPIPAVRARHTTVLRRLLYLALTGHERCLGAAVGTPVSRRIVVPSLRGRAGPHPLSVLAEQMHATTPGAPALQPAAAGTAPRRVSAEHFTLTGAVTGAHVLLLDDTWTTGSRAQSAALTLRGAGATAVSVMVLGRWLTPEFGHNRAFIAERLRADYDPDRCPVTGADCPD
jgi:hypothetical protein